MRLFLDAHISAARVAGPLRAAGHDVRSADEERALDGLSDEALLSLAADEERIMVSFDVADFPDLARRWADEGRAHAGLAIVVGIDHGELGLLARVLEAALKQRPRQADWHDLTAFLDRRLAEG